jgi:hypothetical protein
MDPNLEERTKQLILQREGFRKGLEAFRTIINNYEEGTPIHTIQRNLKELEVEFTSFKKNQCELDDSDEGTTQQDRIDLQQTFYVVTGRATTIISNATKQSEPTTQTPTSNLSNIPAPESADLPKLQLPTFSGAYEDWPGFADQFRCTVHDNPRIDDCKRLTYLRSCLTHDAALTISALKNVAANYSVAWGILEKRYNRPAKIVERHLQEIFNIGSFSRTAIRDLQSYTTKLESHYQALESLGQLTVDAVLLYLCTSKLDREIDLVWKDRVKSTPFPTFKEFLEFLNERCLVIEFPGTTRQTRGHAFITSQSSSHCPICRNPHTIWTCNEFRKRTIDERRAAAEKISACNNCLRTGHSSSQCTAGSCRICGQRHHTLLHIPNAEPPDQALVNNPTPATTPPIKRRKPSSYPNDIPTTPSLPSQSTNTQRQISQ